MANVVICVLIGSISHSLVMLADTVVDKADQTALPSPPLSTPSTNSSSTTRDSASLISRLTTSNKLSQQAKEQIAYFSKTTSGGIVLPLATNNNYSYR